MARRQLNGLLPEGAIRVYCSFCPVLKVSSFVIEAADLVNGDGSLADFVPDDWLWYKHCKPLRFACHRCWARDDFDDTVGAWKAPGRTSKDD